MSLPANWNVLSPIGVGLIGIGTMLLASCALEPPNVPPRASMQPQQIEIGRAATAPEPQPTTGAPTLEQAIQNALLNNPELKADYKRFEALAQEVPQASSLPDPRASYAQFVENVQTRTGEQQFLAGVSQTFPWFGELRLRGRIADKRAMEALESYRAMMLDVIENVTEAWHRLAFEKAALELALEDQATLEQSLEAAASLYATGQRGREALLKAQTELARVENELEGYTASIEALEADLRRLLHSDRTPEVPALDARESLFSRMARADILVEKALSIRPEKEKARLALDRSRIERELARKDDYPDFTFGVNYIGIGDNPAGNPGDEGQDAWNVSAGINIPIPNARRRAAKKQAELREQEAEQRILAVEDRIRGEIESTVPRLRTLESQRAVLINSLLPLAEEAFAASQASYESGRASFLDLLDSQRTYITVRRDLLRIQRDYLLATARLERAIGGTLTPLQVEQNP